ncbi:COP9 signalosome (CSN) subunit [Coemansia sp. RSA 552]|nr:COP9 signalosome (CSN) subunit [Coemansia sp. RSA 552]
MQGAQRLALAQQKYRSVCGQKNGEELSDIIRLDSLYTKRVLDDIWAADGSLLVLESTEPHGVWNEIVLSHLRSAAAYKQGNFVDAYTFQLHSYNAFLRAFRHMTLWGIHTLYAMCRDLYRVACMADKQLPPPMADGSSAHSTKIEEATRAINQGFSMCMTDREPLLSKSRKWGTYHMANLLFSLYLRLKMYNLCDSMIRAIKTSELPVLARFPMSDQVTFRYYRGMLAFRNESYKAAKEDLLFALEHCHCDSYTNKTRILTYLTPIMLAEGSTPQSRLLRRYPPIKALYGEIAKAARAGNLSRFDQIVEEKEHRFVTIGVFLAVERVRKVVVRQLLRKIYLIEGEPSRISFQRFCDGLAAAGIHGVDVPEMEAILADMIFCGYIKGYLSQGHGIAVLSKQQPFPPLSGLL